MGGGVWGHQEVPISATSRSPEPVLDYTQKLSQDVDVMFRHCASHKLWRHTKIPSCYIYLSFDLWLVYT